MKELANNRWDALVRKLSKVKDEVCEKIMETGTSQRLFGNNHHLGTSTLKSSESGDDDVSLKEDSQLEFGTNLAPIEGAENVKKSQLKQSKTTRPDAVKNEIASK